MRRIVSLMILSLLLAGTFALAFNIGLVHAPNETVYINSDGSVSPSSAPISSVNNVTYTLTGNVSYPAYNGIVVERNNTVIDGNGYTVQGNLSGYGLSLTDISNVTIENANIENFQEGIYLYSSSNNTVSGNNVTANSGGGIDLEYSNSSSISGNNVRANGFGINLGSSSDNNTVSGNNSTANVFDGIELFSSSDNNTVSGNTATANIYGIYLRASSGNVLSDNVIADNTYNFGVSGSASGSVLSDFVNHVDTSNLVEGKPVYYLMNKSNIVISPQTYPEGVGYVCLVNCKNVTVQGLALTRNYGGLTLANTTDSKIIGNNLTANGWYGIYLYSSPGDILSGNNVTANYYAGIWLDNSSGNVLSGNNVTANSYGSGIWLDNSSSNNTIYHNNFIGNGAQTLVDSTSIGNTWDNDYPSGGNYWSDYNRTDLYSGQYQNVTGSDGIGDTPYVIDANNTDFYPLMGGFSDFNVVQGVDVQVVSNSTVSDFQFNGTAILFNVSGVNGTTGFCNVCIPTAMLNGTLSVFVNGTQVQYSLLPVSNSSNTCLYFTYGHSAEQITIMPEFPDFLILAMSMLATLSAIAIHKKKHNRS